MAACLLVFVAVWQRMQNQTVNDGVAHSKNPRKCAYHVTFDFDLDLDWAHPGCTLTWSSSCESLVAIRPFACEKKRFAQKFTDGRTDGQTDRRRTPSHCISSFLEWAKNGYWNTKPQTSASLLLYTIHIHYNTYIVLQCTTMIGRGTVTWYDYVTTRTTTRYEQENLRSLARPTCEWQTAEKFKVRRRDDSCNDSCDM